MKKIAPLRPGDLLYLCAPAKKIDTDIQNSAIQTITGHGFKIEPSKHLLNEHYYFSGTIEERLYDLQKGLDHPTAKAIVCARGGYGLIQLLPLLDWTEFKRNPKWIVGFSDVTNLHLEIGQMSFPCIHSTMPLNFSDNSRESLSTLWNALLGESYSIKSVPTALQKIGECKGVLTGGNLSILYSLLGRIPQTYFDHKILFLEDVGEPLYHFDRMIYAMENHGVFANLSGVVFGSFTEIKDNASVFGQSIEEILLRPLKNRNIPVCFDFPAGHVNHNLALRFGEEVTLVVNEFGVEMEFEELK